MQDTEKLIRGKGFPLHNILLTFSAVRFNESKHSSDAVIKVRSGLSWLQIVSQDKSIHSRPWKSQISRSFQAMRSTHNADFPMSGPIYLVTLNSAIPKRYSVIGIVSLRERVIFGPPLEHFKVCACTCIAHAL